MDAGSTPLDVIKRGSPCQLYRHTPQANDTKRAMAAYEPRVTTTDEPKQILRQDPERQPAPPYSIFTRSQKAWIIVIAAWAGWLSTASSFIYFPAIPFMASQMGVSVQQINLTVTSYLIASGVFPTITGSLADMYGRRITLLVSLLVYAGVNVALAVQRSFPVLFVLRMVQSAAISGRSTSRTRLRSQVLMSAQAGIPLRMVWWATWHPPRREGVTRGLSRYCKSIEACLSVSC